MPIMNNKKWHVTGEYRASWLNKVSTLNVSKNAGHFSDRLKRMIITGNISFYFLYGKFTPFSIFPAIFDLLIALVYIWRPVKKNVKKRYPKMRVMKKLNIFYHFYFFSILMVSHIFKQYFTQPWMIFFNKKCSSEKWSSKCWF